MSHPSTSLRLRSRLAGTGSSVLPRFLLGGAILLASVSAYAAPKVVASMLPVHSLVSALMHDVGEPQLLMPAGQSPHVSQLKPSQARMLEKADLVVWIGPQIERSLEKILHERRAETQVVTLLESDEITLLPQREGGHWPGHDHDDHEGHDDHAGHDDEGHDDHAGHEDEGHDNYAGHEDEGHDDHAGHDDEAHDDHDDHAADRARIDPHLWLSFANARAIAHIVTAQLTRMDPANRDRYEANSRELLSKLDRTQQSLREQLSGVAEAPYIVFHDAYQYFEHEFDLHPAGALTINPEVPPGAKRVREIKELIQERNANCIFREPQFPPGLVTTLVADTAATGGVLDPLGAGLQPGADAWFALMQNLADSLTDCLTD